MSLNPNQAMERRYRWLSVTASLLVIYIFGTGWADPLSARFIKPKSRASSGWFSDNGYLRFDTQTGLDTTYELRGVAAQGWQCDGYERDAELSWGREWAEKGGGEDTAEWSSMERAEQEICINRVHLVRNLIDNSNLQLSFRNGVINEDTDRRLAETAHQLVRLAGKRVLSLGDSTDRYALDDLLKELPTAVRHIIDPFDWTHEVDQEYQSDRTARVLAVNIASESADTLTAEQLHVGLAVNTNHSVPNAFASSLLRIDLLFTFGFTSLPKTSEAQPVDVLEKLKLLKPLFGESAEYDLIILPTGLWDMEKINEYYGVPGFKFDDEQHLGEYQADNTPVGLSHKIIREFVERYLAVIDRIRTMYPGVPLALRAAHDLVHTPYDHPKYRHIQMRHLRQAQREIARRAGPGFTLLPFGDLMQGQPWFYRPDGIHPSPAANMVYMETLFRLVAEGRESVLWN